MRNQHQHVHHAVKCTATTGWTDGYQGVTDPGTSWGAAESHSQRWTDLKTTARHQHSPPWPYPQ
jgi:hypothetical protein